jgi:Flp pilus assembly protein TadD
MALRGKYRGTLGDAAGACDDLRKALDLLPERGDFWLDYAFFLRRKGDMESAARAEAEARRLRL